MNVTLLGIAIDHTLNSLQIYLCSSDSFARGAVHLTKILEDLKDGFLKNIDKEGTINGHGLLCIPI